ncbi:MAG: recombinase RmuC [Alphaproteobacteria bacterium]|nr:MAG: recombinase RmuC [Alphaproteobacteria bacterium]
MTLDAIVYIGLGCLLGAALGAVGVMFARQKMSSALATLEARAAQYKDMADTLGQENKTLLGDLQDSRENAVRQEAENEANLRQIEQSKADFKKMEETSIQRFENLSHKIFDEKNQKFKTQSQDSLNELLNPLKEKIGEFEKKINDSFGVQAREQFSLKEQIKNIVESNERITLQAEGLANALKGDSKAQGDWGEIVLEKILEDSGLRKGDDYSVQGGGMNLRDMEGALQKPDVIVNLPENKHVIIDSKVSLTHYERFFSEESEEARPLHLKQFLASVKKHIVDLEQRRYQDTDKLGTPDFVLMFIPIEAAYVLAVQEDRELQSYAWGKKVILVCPTTLFATLRTVASVWRLELQNKNAQEIAKQGGQLYEKVCGFVEDMSKLGVQMGTAQKTYDAAMNKLSEGRGTILGRTEKLKALGAKTSKSLPSELLDVEVPLLGKGARNLLDEDAPEKKRA